MMTYSLEYTKRFRRGLKKLDKVSAKRVLDAVDKILESPYDGSVMVYAGEKCWKWRVGNYRIIYIIDEDKRLVVLIIVGHRGRVYKRL